MGVACTLLVYMSLVFLQCGGIDLVAEKEWGQVLPLAPWFLHLYMYNYYNYV